MDIISQPAVPALLTVKLALIPQLARHAKKVSSSAQVVSPAWLTAKSALMESPALLVTRGFTFPEPHASPAPPLAMSA